MLWKRQGLLCQLAVQAAMLIHPSASLATNPPCSYPYSDIGGGNKLADFS